MSDTKTPENLPKPLVSIDAADGVRDVLARAFKGDESVLSLLKKLLDGDAERRERIFSAYGDSFEWACSALIKVAAGKDLLAQEVLSRKLASVRDELAGPTPTPLERILCERVALTWFDAHEMDRRYVDQAELSFKNAEFRESRRDRANKRFLAACKTLASVRKLALPRDSGQRRSESGQHGRCQVILADGLL